MFRVCALSYPCRDVTRATPATQASEKRQRIPRGSPATRFPSTGVVTHVPQFRRGHLAAAVLFASSSLLGGQALAEDERLEELDERAESVVQLGDEVVLGTAEQELKQAPGVSIITAEDIRKRPPVNDLSEIIRTMPGSTSPATVPAASAATTGRSTSAAWGRRTP